LLLFTATEVQDATSSRLLPGSSYSCCVRNLPKYRQPFNITTAHEILQLRAWQLCTLPLLPNRSSWARTEQMSSIIHRKIVHSKSYTSLAATRKPNYLGMPAKLHLPTKDTEAESNHAQTQQMWDA
jgi:hypothetical protein